MEWIPNTLHTASEHGVSSIRLRLKCDGTRAETKFCLSAKRTSPFKSAEASVQSTTGSLGVRISGSNAGYTKFRGSEGYWLPTPFASFPFTSPPLRHRVPSHFNWTLPVGRRRCPASWKSQSCVSLHQEMGGDPVFGLMTLSNSRRSGYTIRCNTQLSV